MTKILVIDDDPDLRKVVCRVLRLAGHHVIEAGDGNAGMDALRRDGPDLVITDIVMPDQEGIQTITQVREVSSVPIIAVSGSRRTGDFDPLLDAKLMGADITIEKPFTTQALLAAVTELLGGRDRSP